MRRYNISEELAIGDLNYEQKIAINNMRAYFLCRNGLIIYDEPQIVLNDGKESTYLIVTHHHDFEQTISYELR